MPRIRLSFDARRAALAAVCLLAGSLAVPSTTLAQVAAAGANVAEARESAIDDDRITFDVQLDGERGGGRVVGSAGDFDYAEGEYLLATGGVELKYRDVTVRAERVRLDVPDNTLVAEGEVLLDEGPRRLAGDVLEYDLDTRTGRITQATAFVDPEIYFEGDVISKTGPMTYTLEDGVFTSCEGDNPPWSIATTRADITLEEYARIRNARLRFGRVPAFYFPYIIWPATTERTSGWLVPKPGYSDREGFHLSTAYYRTLGRSADTTFYFDLSTEEYNGVGAELRYRPTENTQGILEAYVLFQPDDGFGFNTILDPDRLTGLIPDPDAAASDPEDPFPGLVTPSEERWKFVYFHETDNLWEHWRAVVNLQLYSDFDYLRDVERNFNRQTQSSIYSNAFLSANIDQHSFNILVDQRERITNRRNAIAMREVFTRDRRRQLPELEYRLRSFRLFDSVYLSTRASANYFDIEVDSFSFGIDPETQVVDPGVVSITPNSADYGRLDFAPEIEWSLPGTSWLNASINVGGRVTHYTDSRTLPPTDSSGVDVDGVEDDDETSAPAVRDFRGESLTRFVPSAVAEVVGPSVSRIYETGGARWSKFKHIVEPRFTYTYFDLDEEDELAAPFFDEVDRLRPLNVGVVSIINRLLAKPADEDEGGAFEIASLEVAQGYSFDEDQPGQFAIGEPETSREGPIVTTLRVNPARETNLKLEATYNTLFSNLQAFSLSGGTEIGRHGVGATWFTQWDPVTGDETSDQLRLFTKFEILRDRLTFASEINYNLLDDLAEGIEPLQAQRHLLTWAGQCYGWQLEFREQNFTGFEERDVLFSLTLKNVGTFIDMRESL